MTPTSLSSAVRGRLAVGCSSSASSSAPPCPRRRHGPRRSRTSQSRGRRQGKKGPAPCRNRAWCSPDENNSLRRQLDDQKTGNRVQPIVPATGPVRPGPKVSVTIRISDGDTPWLPVNPSKSAPTASTSTGGHRRLRARKATEPGTPRVHPLWRGTRDHLVTAPSERVIVTWFNVPGTADVHAELRSERISLDTPARQGRPGTPPS